MISGFFFIFQQLDLIVYLSSIKWDMKLIQGHVYIDLMEVNFPDLKSTIYLEGR